MISEVALAGGPSVLCYSLPVGSECLVWRWPEHSKKCLLDEGMDSLLRRCRQRHPPSEVFFCFLL